MWFSSESRETEECRIGCEAGVCSLELIKFVIYFKLCPPRSVWCFFVKEPSNYESERRRPMTNVHWLKLSRFKVKIVHEHSSTHNKQDWSAQRSIRSKETLSGKVELLKDIPLKSGSQKPGIGSNVKISKRHRVKMWVDAKQYLWHNCDVLRKIKKWLQRMRCQSNPSLPIVNVWYAYTEP